VIKLSAAEELEQFEKSVKADIAEAGGCFTTTTRPTFNLQRSTSTSSARLYEHSSTLVD
jgi:hypothetical protein